MATLREKGRAGNWNYSGDPSSSDRDWCRFTLGDVVRDDQLVSDEEIAFAIADTGSKQLGTARLAEHLSALFSREADETINDGSNASRSRQLSQRASAFKMLAEQIRTSHSGGAVGVYAGGISDSDIETREDDTDRVGSPFKVGMMDNPPA